MESYIDRIKLLKSQKKMTNETLAERSGIPLGTLSKILAGMSDSPKLANIVAICGALDCSVEYIVSGIPENTNNYTLSAGEVSLVETYRALDRHGKELVELVLQKEKERAESADAAPEERETARPEPEKSAKVLRPVSSPFNRYAEESAEMEKRRISLYELPVSAGVGEYLDEARAETITIPKNEKTAEADYALRISGSSMEPKYHDGDILLVQTADSVEVGELGIFLLDGAGFFKTYAGDRLLSLNPAYSPIPLREYADVQCKGRVVGRLRRK